MGYVTLEGDKWEEGWMADGCVNWFMRGYAMSGLGLDSNPSVLKNHGQSALSVIT